MQIPRAALRSGTITLYALVAMLLVTGQPPDAAAQACQLPPPSALPPPPLPDGRQAPVQTLTEEDRQTIEAHKLLEEALKLGSTGDRQKELELLKQAEKLASTPLLADRSEYGFIYGDLGRWSEAIKEFDSYFEKEGAYAPRNIMVVDYLIKHSKADVALRFSRTLSKLAPTAELLDCRSRALAACGRKEESAVMHEKALRLAALNLHSPLCQGFNELQAPAGAQAVPSNRQDFEALMFRLATLNKPPSYFELEKLLDEKVSPPIIQTVDHRLYAEHYSFDGASSRFCRIIHSYPSPGSEETLFIELSPANFLVRTSDLNSFLANTSQFEAEPTAPSDKPDQAQNDSPAQTRVLYSKNRASHIELITDLDSRNILNAISVSWPPYQERTSEIPAPPGENKPLPPSIDKSGQSQADCGKHLQSAKTLIAKRKFKEARKQLLYSILVIEEHPDPAVVRRAYEDTRECHIKLYSSWNRPDVVDYFENTFYKKLRSDAISVDSGRRTDFPGFTDYKNELCRVTGNTKVGYRIEFPADYAGLEIQELPPDSPHFSEIKSYFGDVPPSGRNIDPPPAIWLDDACFAITEPATAPQ